MVGSTFTHAPEEAAAKEYRQLLPIFIHLSRVLEEDYTRIANYQRKLTKHN
jgi:gluconokinase